LSSLLFWLILLTSGFIAGGITGLLGMGGSLLLVPVMMALGLEPVQAVGTCSLAMFIVTISGSWHNWRAGNLAWQEVLVIGIPALLTAQVGVHLAKIIAPKFLLLAIALLILINIYFKLRGYQQSVVTTRGKAPLLKLSKQMAIGCMAGLISGMVGISGGVVIFPSQILLLQTEFEGAVQTSVGVMILSTGSAFVGHGWNGHVLLKESLALGSTGILGMQSGSWLLTHYKRIIHDLAQSLLIVLICTYLTWQIWQTDVGHDRY